MIDKDRFDRIRAFHGAYASWAVWSPPTSTAKSNVGDLEVLDPNLNPALLASLNPEIVMLGLNLSRLLRAPLANFHDDSKNAQDYKLRYALQGTPWWGGYMTDIIKDLPAVNSNDPKLRLSPEQMEANVDRFVGELRDLGSTSPTLLAFGAKTYARVKRYVLRRLDLKLIRLTHYSHFISAEDYREEIRRKSSADSFV